VEKEIWFRGQKVEEKELDKGFTVGTNL